MCLSLAGLSFCSPTGTLLPVMGNSRDMLLFPPLPAAALLGSHLFGTFLSQGCNLSDRGMGTPIYSHLFYCSGTSVLFPFGECSRKFVPALPHFHNLIISHSLALKKERADDWSLNHSLVLLCSSPPWSWLSFSFLSMKSNQTVLKLMLGILFCIQRENLSYHSHRSTISCSLYTFSTYYIPGFGAQNKATSKVHWVFRAIYFLWEPV